MKLYTYQAFMLVLWLLSTLTVGTVESSSPDNEGKGQESSIKTVSIRPSIRVIHQRIQNAIARYDLPKIKVLRAKVGSLEKQERNVLIKQAQNLVDQSEQSVSLFNNKKDLLTTVMGGAAVMTGLIMRRKELVSLASWTKAVVKDSLSTEKIIVPDDLTPVQPMTDEEEIRLLFDFGVSAALIMGGLSALRRVFTAPQGPEHLLEARKIEQALYEVPEVGTKASLNIKHS